MLSYGLAAMAGVAGGICPASVFGDTNIMHGTKTGGRSPMNKSTYDMQSEYIGIAEMEADGTIVLRLNAPLDGGATVGHGYFSYPIGAPQYQDILRHVGPLEPGENKPVRPWPETSKNQK